MLLTCPLCPEVQFTMIARYLNHADEHHPSARHDYLCPGCPPQDHPNRFRRRALEQHIRLEHRAENITANVRCKDCSLLIFVVNIKAHLQQHAQESCRFSCPRLNCNAVFQSSNLKTKFGMVYKKHNMEVHNNMPFLPDIDSLTQQVHDFNNTQNMDWDDPEDNEASVNDVTFGQVNVVESKEEAFGKKFLALWLQTQFCDLLPENQIDKIINVLGELVFESSEHLLSQLILVLPDHSTILEETFRKHDVLKKNFASDGGVTTAYGRRKLADSVTNMLHPQVLSSFPQLQASKKSEIYRVPLADIIQQQLARRNWDPDRHDGYFPEFEYIEKLR
jgi:hypothetical protein